jgi:hypothetical protein
VNYESYTRIVDMATRLAEVLQHSAINLEQKPLDMMDVQSFMWVVERYVTK